jgi:hypothetical protein
MKPKRRLPPRGTSYVDANKGLVVTLEDDVNGIKNEIEGRWPMLQLCIDTTPDIQEPFLIIEHCLDNTDRLVFSTDTLDGRTVDRCARAYDCDIEAEVDAGNAARDAEIDRKFSDKIGDASERLMHAIRKDGLGGIPSVYFKDSNGHSGNEDRVEAVRGTERQRPAPDVA